jgi:hypothetical protein
MVAGTATLAWSLWYDAPPAEPVAEIPIPAPPVGPASVPVVAPSVGPASVPVEPPPPAVEPAPAPVAPDPALAEVVVRGVDRVWLVDDEGHRFRAGRVPPGLYGVDVFFDPARATRVLTLELARGERREIRCDASLRLCR